MIDQMEQQRLQLKAARRGLTVIAVVILILAGITIARAAPEAPQLHLYPGVLVINDLDGLKYPYWWYLGTVRLKENSTGQVFDVELRALSAGSGELVGKFCRRSEGGFLVLSASIAWADDTVPVFVMPGSTYRCERLYMPLIDKHN